MREDSAAYWLKLNKGSYKHIDFKVGDPDPVKWLKLFKLKFLAFYNKINYNKIL